VANVVGVTRRLPAAPMDEFADSIAEIQQTQQFSGNGFPKRWEDTRVESA